MKPKKFLVILGIILFIAGCGGTSMICSLNPFYLEKNIVLSKEIEGIWSVTALNAKSDSRKDITYNWQLADTSAWQINQYIFEEKQKSKSGKDSTVFKPQQYYIVKLTDSHPDSAQYQFKLVLFQINGSLYGDFSPWDMQAIKSSRMAQENLFEVHTLARINVKNNQLNLSWLGSDYMKEMIEKKRVRIKYHYVKEGSRLLLTASSEDLTHMIEKYGHQTRFIDWEDQYATLKLTRLNQLP